MRQLCRQAIRAGWPAVTLARALREGMEPMVLQMGVIRPPMEAMWLGHGNIALVRWYPKPQ